MTDYIATSADLTTVADAIRTKGGTSAPLVFPNGFATAIENIPTGTPTLETKSKTYTATESQQTDQVTPSVGYDGLDKVNVTINAIPSNYVGSGITQRTSTDLSASGATVTAPAGYYASNATKSVASGTAGTPTATKSAVSNHSLTVTPSVTNTTGYITGSTKTGTAVSVSASELVSGTKSITANGTGIDVTNYAAVDVSVSGGGGVDVPTFTLTYDDQQDTFTVTCDKTRNELYAYLLGEMCAAVVTFSDGGAIYSAVGQINGNIFYFVADDTGLPVGEIEIAYNGTMTFSMPPSNIISLTATTNNTTYTAPYGKAYNEVIVNVPAGLEYEAGTWTPMADISSVTISFTDTHTTAPCMYMLSDVTGTYNDTTNTNYAVSYSNWYNAFGTQLYASTTALYYGVVRYVYRASSTTSLTAGNSTLTESGDESTWVTNTGIIAHSNSTSRYWRAGRTYKWVAIWAPTV